MAGLSDLRWWLEKVSILGPENKPHTLWLHFLTRVSCKIVNRWVQNKRSCQKIWTLFFISVNKKTFMWRLHLLNWAFIPCHCPAEFNSSFLISMILKYLSAFISSQGIAGASGPLGPPGPPGLPVSFFYWFTHSYRFYIDDRMMSCMYCPTQGPQGPKGSKGSSVSIISHIHIITVSLGVW